MANTSMNDVPESPEQRMQRRRARRWKRRARIAGPLLGLPLLVATLALSVDLITYSPVTPQKKLTDRPLPEATRERSSTRIPLPATGISTTPVVEPATGTPSIDLDLDLSLEGETASLTRDFPPPARPYALRDSR